MSLDLSETIEYFNDTVNFYEHRKSKQMNEIYFTFKT